MKKKFNRNKNSRQKKISHRIQQAIGEILSSNNNNSINKIHTSNHTINNPMMKIEELALIIEEAIEVAESMVAIISREVVTEEVTSINQKDK